MTIARHLVIRGRVQGVGFRYYTVDEARRLGVLGWVRNRRDGTVESHVQGDEAAVQQLIAWTRNGPPSAQVHEVDVEDAEPGEYGGFETRPTV